MVQVLSLTVQEICIPPAKTCSCWNRLSIPINCCLGRSSIRCLLPLSRQSDLPGFGYGYGWFVTKILGRPILLSTGGGRSFVTVYFRLPADGLTLIVLTNQGDEEFMCHDDWHCSSYCQCPVPQRPDLRTQQPSPSCSCSPFCWLPKSIASVKTTWVIGILWLLLAAPFALVFSRYLAEGRGVWTLLPLSLVLLLHARKSLAGLCVSGWISGVTGSRAWLT
jgi:hypothetical protein